MILNEILKLMKCFPGSSINSDGYLLLNKQRSGFSVADIESEEDLKCKLLESVSRDACKTMVYQQHIRNVRFWNRTRKSINQYLQTNFSDDDMLDIYQHLGNGIRHKLTKEFVQSKYDLKLIKEVQDGRD